MIGIGVLGYGGRMGRLIAEEITADPRCRFTGGGVRSMKPEYGRSDNVLVTTKIEDMIAASDVVIDFSSAEATAGYARLAATRGKAFMSGTTGIDDTTMQALRDAAHAIPVLYAPNTSLSLAAMAQLTTLAAKLLGDFDYDVSIVEEHHRHKKDAPSGTAKVLGAAVTAGSGGKKTAQFASIRAGEIIGEHEVIFAGNGEVIRMHHSVTDRRIFARGAVEAALWLYGKPKGFYEMDGVLRIFNN